jgi:hypothetical protein
MVYSEQTMTKIISLRRKYVNSTLVNKTCNKCNKTYPRTSEFFYKTNHPSIKNTFRYNSICVNCENTRSLKWKKKNKIKNKQSQIKYLSTERGYFKELWATVKTSTHGCEFKNYEEFFNCWIEQQKIYGIKCPYTGIEMTKIKGINLNEYKRKRTDTNISKDRILSSRPYSKKNLMFVCWGINNSKGNISPKIAKQYLQFVKERFGTDEME